MSGYPISYFAEGSDGSFSLCLMYDGPYTIKLHKSIAKALGTSVIRLGGFLSVIADPKQRGVSYAYTKGFLHGKLRTPEWFDVGELAVREGIKAC